MYIDKNKVNLEMARQKITYKELANRMGIHETVPYHLLKAGRDLSPKTVGKIATALNVDPVEIVKQRSE